jgi:putative two-component system hydrogenase maturation factor HypX/HoxX
MSASSCIRASSATAVPSALDWALQEGAAEWGVTVLQAEAEMDAGPVWATANFPLRAAKKSSIYRNEVTQAATTAVLAAVDKVAAGRSPTPLAAWPDARGRLRPLMKQADRAIDWQRDDTATVLRKINAADGFPGVADALFGQSLPHLRCLAEEARRRRYGGRGRRTARDGAVAAHRRWRGLDRPRQAPGRHQAAGYAGLCRGGGGAAGGAARYGWWRVDHATWQDIAYEESAGVGFLHFEFYNGAMSTASAVRLRAALAWAKQRPVKVLVLLGGADFWSNGIHLNVIEAASLDDGRRPTNPGTTSMR